MKRSLCPGGETLIAYQDGDLTPAEHAMLAEHVRACPVCRTRLHDSEAIGALLRAHYPLVHDETGLRMVKDRIRFLTPAPPPPPSRAPAWRPLAAACLVIAMVAAAFQLQSTAADFRLGRFVEFVRGNEGDAPEIVTGANQPPGTPLTGVGPPSDSQSLTFQPVKPAELPFDLVLAEESVQSPDRLVLAYRRGTELAIRVVEERAERATSDAQTSLVEIVAIQNTEVAVERNSLGDIGRLVWERDGVVFDVMILQTPIEGLSNEDAVRLVEALILVQMSN